MFKQKLFYHMLQVYNIQGTWNFFIHKHKKKSKKREASDKYYLILCFFELLRKYTVDMNWCQFFFL